MEFHAESLAKRKTAGFRDSSAPPDGVGVNAPELPESDAKLRLGCRIRLSGGSGAFHAPGRAEGGCDTPQIGRFVVCKVGQKWDTRKVKKESPQSAGESTLGAL